MTESRQQLLSDPKARANALSRIPSGRFATPEEIAAAVVYLASPAAAPSPAIRCRSMAG